MAKKDRKSETPSDGKRIVIEFPDKFAEFVSRNGRLSGAAESAGEVHRSVETGVGGWTLVLGSARKR